MSFTSDITIYSLGLVFQVFNLRKYTGCPVPMGLLMVILFSSIVSFRTFLELTLKKVGETLSILVAVLSMVSIIVSAMTGLVFMIIISAKEKDGIETEYFIFNWIIMGLCNFFILVTIIVIIVIIVISRKQNKEKQRSREETEKVYEKIYDPSFNAEDFIEVHKNTIDSYPFSDKEMKILEDYFSKPYESRVLDGARMTEGSEAEEEAECPICFDSLQPGVQYIQHPGCSHVYHDNGLGTWLKKQSNCPMCKRGTRSNMILKINKDKRVPNSLA